MNNGTKEYIDSYLEEAKLIIEKLDKDSIHKAIEILIDVRTSRGRLFILGVGGSAGNASHAVNDFRKLGGMESYAPTDNVSEITARTNDDGWNSVFVRWLQTSWLSEKDLILVLSVGGGNAEKNISANIVEALKYAKQVGARIIGIVGRDGGYTKQVADVCVLIPTVNPETVTPHAESFQAVVWHLIVSNPGFRLQEGKWESAQKEEKK
ncbi:MAG: Sugar isomerase family protein [Parcubacteria group bacterium Gr01-1014_3]|nr:MAG: Sugar isomerase family protein [Parcubacteria group bacterium Gr01-1014_3]